MKPVAPLRRDEQAPRARMAPLADGIVAGAGRDDQEGIMSVAFRVVFPFFLVVFS